MVGTGRHLWQMGYTEHLSVSTELFHEAAHGLGHCAAYAGINFVKNQCLRAAEFAGGDSDGQGDARQLTARGHLVDGSG